MPVQTMPTNLVSEKEETCLEVLQLKKLAAKILESEHPAFVKIIAESSKHTDGLIVTFTGDKRTSKLESAFEFSRLMQRMGKISAIREVSFFEQENIQERIDSTLSDIFEMRKDQAVSSGREVLIVHSLPLLTQNLQIKQFIKFTEELLSLNMIAYILIEEENVQLREALERDAFIFQHGFLNFSSVDLRVMQPAHVTDDGIYRYLWECTHGIRHLVRMFRDSTEWMSEGLPKQYVTEVCAMLKLSMRTSISKVSRIVRMSSCICGTGDLKLIERVLDGVSNVPFKRIESFSPTLHFDTYSYTFHSLGAHAKVLLNFAQDYIHYFIEEPAYALRCLWFLQDSTNMDRYQLVQSITPGKTREETNIILDFFSRLQEASLHPQGIAITGRTKSAWRFIRDEIVIPAGLHEEVRQLDYLLR